MIAILNLSVLNLKRGLSCTKPGSLLRNQIPIKTDQWNEFNPGFIEADTVHHCAESTEGQYALTVNYTDIATQWTQQRAVWGKGQTAVFKQTQDVEDSLPFQRVLEADSKYVSNSKKRELEKLFASLNPFILREAMEKKIGKIFRKLHSSQ